MSNFLFCFALLSHVDYVYWEEKRTFTQNGCFSALSFMKFYRINFSLFFLP